MRALDQVIATIPEALRHLDLHMDSDPDLELLAAGKRADGHDFNRVFTRDTIQSLLLMSHIHTPLLGNHVIFSLRHQGQHIDPHSGQEVGKSPHENPAGTARGRSSEYASVDTTPYSIVGAAEYWRRTGSNIFIERLEPYIVRAYHYIDSHLDGGLLRDDPADYHATATALGAGYFRDGGFESFPFHKQPYPAYYFNASALAARALRDLAELREAGLLAELPSAETLRARARETVEALNKSFWMEDGYFTPCIYPKQGLRIEPMYLDPIWSCWYLEPEDIAMEHWDQMFESLKRLEHEYGYMNREWSYGYAEDGDKLELVSPSIWPIETAQLMELAGRMNHPEVLRQGMKLAEHLAHDAYPFREFVELGPDNVYRNCDYQLWTVAFFEVVARYRTAIQPAKRRLRWMPRLSLRQRTAYMRRLPVADKF